MKKFIYLFAVALFAMVSCNDETQSELTESMLGMSGEATIELTFYYNQGPHEVNGVIFEGVEVVPSDVEVIATVDYSAYSNQDAKVNYRQIKAQSLGKGKYRLTIPAGEKKIPVQVMPKGFTAKFYTTPEISVNAYYEFNTPLSLNVLAGQTVVMQDPTKTTIPMSGSELNNDANTEYTISGKVTGYKETYSEDDGIEAEEFNVSGCTLKVEVGCSTDAQQRVNTYTVVCGSDGKYEAKIKLYDTWDFDKVSVNISPVSYTDQFVHHYMYLDSATLKSSRYTEAENSTNMFRKVDDEFKEVEVGSKNPYNMYKHAEITLDGYWKGTDLDIALAKDKVELLGKEDGRDIEMSFVTGKKSSDIPGVTEGKTGLTFKLKEKKSDSDKTLTFGYKFTEYLLNNVMGW